MNNISKEYLEKFILINKFLPEININNYKIIKSGFASLAIIINNEIVIRFAINKNFGNNYLKEKQIIDKIRPFITAKLPNLIIYHDKENLISVHKIINGIQYTELNDVQRDLIRDSLAKELANFLYELHSIKPDNSEYNKRSIIEDYQINKNYDLILNYLKDKYRIKDFEKSIDIVKNFKSLENDYVICHNDFNENNILIDFENKRLAGIIDFGESLTCNFNNDFTALTKCDFDLVKKIIDNYEKLAKRLVNISYIISLQKLKSYANIGIALANNSIPGHCFVRWLNRLYAIR